MIEQVAREVMARIGAGGGAASPAARMTGARVLAIAMAGADGVDAALSAVRQAAAAGHPVTAVVGREGEIMVGAERLRSAGAVQVLQAGTTMDADELLSQHRVVVLLNPTPDEMAQLVSLSAGEFWTDLTHRALGRGMPVLAASANGRQDGGPLRAQQSLYQVRGLGVRVTPAGELGAELLAALGKVPAVPRHGEQEAGERQVVTAPAKPAGGAPAAPVQAASPPGISSPRVEPFDGPAVGQKGGGLPGDICKSWVPGGVECDASGKCVVRKKGSLDAIIECGADRICAGEGVSGDQVEARIAAMIDHTLLKSNATETEVAKLCEEAKKYRFASVCINPSWVGLSANLLRGSTVKVCTVVGFPLGATSTTAKAVEARDAIAAGADEVDMVMNVGAMKSGNTAAVFDDIRALREATRGRILKVILETAFLTREEKIKACELAKAAGADFVKTSTGFGPGGATVEDIQLMRQTVGPLLGVKASGGVRTREDALKMVQAGATRIGASASVAIVTGEKPGEGKY